MQLSPPHRHLEFMSPLSGSRADELVVFLATHARGNVIDVGCGWGALLIRLLKANRCLKGVGLDLDDQGFEHAIRVATAQGVAERLRLIAGDAKHNLPTEVGGAICVGATQVWGPPVEAGMPLDYPAALAALRSMVPIGAPVVYGEGIWSTKPTEAAVAVLSGRLDEFVFLPDFVDLAWKAGFAVVSVHEANQDEWDTFESGYTARYAEWLAVNEPSHPEYECILKKTCRQRDAYFRGYRGVLGMAYLCLLAV